MDYFLQLSLTRLYLDFLQTVFYYIKTQISQSLIPQIAIASTRALVGIAKMSGSNFNLTKGRLGLGGYITEGQSPIQVRFVPKF